MLNSKVCVSSDLQQPSASGPLVCCLQAIIRRVADDHSFQLQCMREAAAAAEDRRPAAKPSAGGAGATSSGVLPGALAAAASAAGSAVPPHAADAAAAAGGKRTWSGKGDGGGAFALGAESGLLEGIFMLQVSSLLNAPKLVLWKRVDEMLYACVFEVTENCLLVSSFLTLFIHILADIFGVHADSPPLTDLFQKRPDALLVTLHHLLPGPESQSELTGGHLQRAADVHECGEGAAHQSRHQRSAPANGCRLAAAWEALTACSSSSKRETSSKLQQQQQSGKAAASCSKLQQQQLEGRRLQQGE
ncbi:hypothetical protein Efla_004436 [Eimeria flavescens]